MITTLLFDVDGVLLVGEPWSKDLPAAYGITTEMLAPFFKNAFPACLIGKADLKEELAPYLSRWNWPLSVDDFTDYWFRHYTLDQTLLQHIQQLRQNGIRCYLATQQERYRTDYILHTLGFAHQFDGILSSVDLGFLKNETSFFEAVLRFLDPCQPAEMLFWDDSATNVTIARSVGLRAEIYSNFTSFLATMKDYDAKD